jgi:tetratricopeptide (TPR) repeat protein
MALSSTKIRPFFKTIAAIVGGFSLALVIAYLADKLTAPVPKAIVVQTDVADASPGLTKQETPPPLTEKEIAERLDWELYGYSRPWRHRLRVLMERGDGCLLSNFRTDFVEDFKAAFGARICKEEQPEPGSDLIQSAVLEALGEILTKDGVARRVTFAELPGNPDNLPNRAYACYFKSLAADRELAIKHMDDLLALPAEERLALNAIAKYRRARLKMSLEDWDRLDDAAVKERLKSIREDLGSVALHAREGSLDPAKISENAVYWIAYSCSMILPTERLVRLGEADFGGALRAYLRMPRRGQANAVNSCLWMASKLSADGYFEGVVADPDLRQLMTLFLTAGGGNDTENMIASDILTDRRVAWLDALAKAKVEPSFAPAHIAMLQYAVGRWQDCRRTAESLGPDEPLRKLLLSRCQLRLEGDLAASRRLLAPDLAATAPTAADGKPHGPVTGDFDYPTIISLQEKPELVARIEGELGMIALANGNFADALTRFENGAYGVEALYVAECLLTIDELKAHVDRRRAEKKPLITLDGRWNEPLINLEQELGSRLMRAGRLEEALDYVDPAIRNKATQYVLLRRGAERTDLGDRSRADSYWRCALAIREIGEQVLHAPYGLSWASGGSWYVGYSAVPRTRHGLRLDDRPLPSMKRVGASQAEIRLIEEWQVRYIENPDLSERDARYASFRHALEAVRLLPDNDPAGAEILQYAGNLLKYREPKAAVPAYRMLVSRFPQTPYGRHAVAKKWFSPDRPEPSADLLSK